MTAAGGGALPSAVESAGAVSRAAIAAALPPMLESRVRPLRCDAPRESSAPRGVTQAVLASGEAAARAAMRRAVTVTTSHTHHDWPVSAAASSTDPQTWSVAERVAASARMSGVAMSASAARTDATRAHLHSGSGVVRPSRAAAPPTIRTASARPRRPRRGARPSAGRGRASHRAVSVRGGAGRRGGRSRGQA